MISFSASRKPIPSSSEALDPFPRLPLELRTQIWHAVAQQPRTLDLWRLPIGTLFFHDSYPNQPPNSVKGYRFCTTRPVPSLLHVNQESRAIALQHYVLAFGCVNAMDDDYGITMSAPPRIYVNWKTDIILFLGETDDSAIPDALTSDVPAEGASIAIEISGVQFEEEWNQLTAIAANGGVREVRFFNGELTDGVQLDFKLFPRATLELVDLEDGEEQRPELLLIKGRDALELQFQQLEANVNGEYRFDYIDWEEAEARMKALERRPVVRFTKLSINRKSGKRSEASKWEYLRFS
ncbi:hypothetical protein N431DRAFT_429858 [Stipitochalara longipes BDJ]|nr:hypothetical protein N431DRAFT_429858 [Stipitochalara longipes BDJ]